MGKDFIEKLADEVFPNDDFRPALFGLGIYLTSKFLDGFGLKFRYTLFIVCSLAIVVGYWMSPKSEIPFRRYVITRIGGVLVLILNLFFLPDLLRLWMPLALVYAISVFLFAVSLYWLPQVYWGKTWDNKKEQPIAFYKWGIGSLLFSILVALILIFIFNLTGIAKATLVP